MQLQWDDAIPLLSSKRPEECLKISRETLVVWEGSEKENWTMNGLIAITWSLCTASWPRQLILVYEIAHSGAQLSWTRENAITHSFRDCSNRIVSTTLSLSLSGPEQTDAIKSEANLWSHHDIRHQRCRRPPLGEDYIYGLRKNDLCGILQKGLLHPVFSKLTIQIWMSAVCSTSRGVEEDKQSNEWSGWSKGPPSNDFSEWAVSLLRQFGSVRLFHVCFHWSHFC